MSTPSYIVRAVDAFRKQRDPSLLIQMFSNGLPLYEYPESRELICELLEAVANKNRFYKRGERKTTKKQSEHSEKKEFSACLRFAALNGAGLPKKGESARIGKRYAHEVIEEEFGWNAEHFYKRIWPKYKNCNVIENQRKLGEAFPDFILQDIK